MGPARVARASAHDVLDDRFQNAQLLLSIDDFARRAQHHDRAIVHRVMESGTGQHQSVEKSDGHARRHALPERAEHAAGTGAVEVQRLADPRVNRGDDHRMTLDDEADVADQALVEDRVDRRLIVAAALRKTSNSRVLALF